MATNDYALTQALGAVWIQPDGPNTKPEYLACIDSADLAETLKTIEYGYCRQPDGSWRTISRQEGPPEKITTSIDKILFPEGDTLDNLINCPVGLYFLQRSGGRADLFTNFERAIAVHPADIVKRTDKNIAHHLDANQSMATLDIEAAPPAFRTGTLVARRMTTTETQALNDVAFCNAMRCYGPQGATQKLGDSGIIAADSAVGPATANLLVTGDAGDNWAAAAADPFAAVAGGHIMSACCYYIDRDTIRWLVALEAPVGGQGQVAYSDDGGATWTNVNIGGAAAGHGAFDSGALFALDMYHIWLASAEGYIYFSEDGGVTWTAQEAGGIGVGDYHAVTFADIKHGMAVGAADLIAFTSDGGENWQAGTATGGGGDLLCVSWSNGFWWTGDDDGNLWFSDDDAVTWSERTNFAGTGTGDITDIAFWGALNGFMLHATAGGVGELFRTIDGGWTWQEITLPTTAVLNALWIAAQNIVYAVGEAEGGTGVILKVTWG